MPFIDWERNGRVAIPIIFNYHPSLLRKHLSALEATVSQAGKGCVSI